MFFFLSFFFFFFGPGTVFSHCLLQVTSVTTLVHKFFEPFNADNAIAKMRAGARWHESPYVDMDDDEIKAAWEENRNHAAAAGTRMHKDIEDIINGIKPFPADPVRELQLFAKFRSDYATYIPYRTEWMVFDETHKLAGSIGMYLRARTHARTYARTYAHARANAHARTRTQTRYCRHGVLDSGRQPDRPGDLRLETVKGDQVHQQMAKGHWRIVAPGRLQLHPLRATGK